MIFVLDRSSSMNMMAWNKNHNYLNVCNNEVETKLNKAKNSVIKFMDNLNEKDLFGLVSFDDMPFIEQPLVHITNENKNKIVNNIRNITAGGCTNISDAIEKAYSMINEKHIKEYDCKIILISDGQANSGITNVDGLSTLSLKLFKSGVTISTLGIGLDYDSKILNRISTSGGGLFYHVENLNELDDIFEEELSLSRNSAVKGVKIYLEIPDLIEISNNLNDYTQNIERDLIEVFIGDMHTRKSILFEIKNNFVDDDIAFNIKVTYKTKDGLEHIIKASKILRVVKSKSELKRYKESKEVLKKVLSLIRNKTILHTAELYENGKIDNIKDVFSASKNNLNEILSTYTGINVSKLKEDFNNLEKQYLTKQITRSMNKTFYATSSMIMKNS